MRTQQLKNPTLTPLNHYKNDPLKAVAILTEFTVKYQGGPRVKQEKAALIAVSLFSEGMTAVAAIKSAVNRVMLSS